MIALLAFPLIVEPLLGARMIGLIWTAGFVILGGMLFWSGRLAKLNNVTREQSSIAPQIEPAPNNIRRLYWIILAAIPSSLMLAVTSKISADIGSFPLVWIIPLALYLVSFIIAFSGRHFLSAERQAVIIPACLIFLLFATRIEGISAVGWTNFLILIVTFFLLAIIAHKRLYDARPSEDHLTQFYIFMSLGGALGGFFNSIIATHMFNDIHEVPIVIAAASILIWNGKTKPTLTDMIRAIVFGGIAILVALLLPKFIGDTLAQPNLIAVTFVGFLLVFILKNSAWQSAISLALFVLVTYFAAQPNHVYQTRSVFGVHRIVDNDGVREYFNGTTLHGAERISEKGSRPTPLTYYHPNGPMGRIMLAAQTQETTSIGIVGLGVGSLACYRQPHQNWDLYEIDPVVDDIARNPNLFNFVDQCAADIPTHIGDARLVLAKQTPKNFDILLIDAFSSDAIPVHLITKEAIELYLSHMNDNGILVMHISNRYFALQKPLSKIASELGLIALGTRYAPATNAKNVDQASAVAIFARNQSAIERFVKDDTWRSMTSDYRHLWTDDYSNLLSTLR
ncbi:fused MFS/spermidine synthase [Paramylibacter kogurei]|uniref:fused MFS/spermidine synthase n=1 Tax=Paramylibacter kogurei TaxID=1889778 RepID=UPI001F0B0E20|nr:fused MFS/spermidine synthase [Amylibacter kogurei]